MSDLLSPAQVERLPVGSILFPAERGKATGSALIVIPGRLLTPISQLPERAGGEEPGGDPIPAWGIREFFLIQKGKGRLPTGPTAHRHAWAWYQKMQRERRVRSHLIRLAHANPGKIRDAVLPLLREAGVVTKDDLAGKDNSFGRGFYPLPPKLLGLPRFSDAFRHVLDHKVWPEGAEGEVHMLTVPLKKASVMRRDMENLMKLGFLRMISNDAGTLSFYFKG